MNQTIKNIIDNVEQKKVQIMSTYKFCTVEEVVVVTSQTRVLICGSRRYHAFACLLAQLYQAIANAKLLKIRLLS